MIAAIVQTGFRSLRRDRGALILSFVVPVVFFSVFATIFSNSTRNGTPRVSVLIVDEDRSTVSDRLVRALGREGSLHVQVRPEANRGQPEKPVYTAASAEAAVKAGDAPSALIIPAGFGANPTGFGQGGTRGPLRILHDSSDPVAAQVLAGMVQKVMASSLADTIAGQGMTYFDQAAGGLTPEQRKSVASNLAEFSKYLQQRGKEPSAQAAKEKEDDAGGFVSIETRDVVGEKKRSPTVSFYAAGIGVMFLLFSASAAGGSLLDEADSGALDRMLSARVSMTTLLAGKLAYSALLACAQLTVMFLWGAAVFHLDLFTHIPGFVVMTVSTAFAAAAFGMLLASISRTRAQQAALGTLLVLTMSAVGGSMFPRFLMPEGMQKFGLVTVNAWAIDGFTKVFWRDEPVSQLLPQVAALIGGGLLLFLIARRFARKWEYS